MPGRVRESHKRLCSELDADMVNFLLTGNHLLAGRKRNGNVPRVTKIERIPHVIRTVLVIHHHEDTLLDTCCQTRTSRWIIRHVTPASVWMNVLVSWYEKRLLRIDLTPMAKPGTEDEKTQPLKLCGVVTGSRCSEKRSMSAGSHESVCPRCVGMESGARSRCNL